MTTRFSRPDACQWEVSDVKHPHREGRVRLSISASGIYSVVDALELAEAITFEARRAEEKNLQACLVSA